MRTLALKREDIFSGDLILVNKSHGYLGNGEDSLVPVWDSSVLMQQRAVVLLSNLMEEIGGCQKIVPVSGWRSLEEQKKIWEDSLTENGREFTEKYVALPGHSEHQTGLAIDLGKKQKEIDFICPDFPYDGICQTFRKRAEEYGFIERYPAGKETVTGIGHEPWHFRYVGIPHACIMAEFDFTMEEYVDFIREFCYGRNPYYFNRKSQEIFISYQKADTEGYTEIKVDGTMPYSVSGNNIDGFIITEWRGVNG